MFVLRRFLSSDDPRQVAAAAVQMQLIYEIYFVRNLPAPFRVMSISTK